jgi:hypothetical protein
MYLNVRFHATNPVHSAATTLHPIPNGFARLYTFTHWRAARGAGATRIAGMATKAMVALPPRR